MKEKKIKRTIHSDGISYVLKVWRACIHKNDHSFHFFSPYLFQLCELFDLRFCIRSGLNETIRMKLDVEMWTLNIWTHNMFLCHWNPFYLSLLFNFVVTERNASIAYTLAVKNAVNHCWFHYITHQHPVIIYKKLPFGTFYFVRSVELPIFLWEREIIVFEIDVWVCAWAKHWIIVFVVHN